MAARARHMMSIAEAALADVVLPPTGLRAAHRARAARRRPRSAGLELPAAHRGQLRHPGGARGQRRHREALPAHAALRRALRARVRRGRGARAPRAGARTATTRRASAWSPTSASTTSSSPGASSAGTASSRRRRSASSTRASSSAATTRRTSRPTATSRRRSRTSSTAPSTTPARAAAPSSASTCTSRVYGRFLELAEPLVRAYVMGDPMDAETTLGPIAQPRARRGARGVRRATRARAAARVVAGGKAASVDGRGRFFEATLARRLRPRRWTCCSASRSARSSPVMPVDSDEEALAKMNDSRLGLTASVWTTRSRPRRALRARPRVRHRLHEPLRLARPGAPVERREGLGPRREPERARLRRADAPEVDPLPPGVGVEGGPRRGSVLRLVDRGFRAAIDALGVVAHCCEQSA